MRAGQDTAGGALRGDAAVRQRNADARAQPRSDRIQDGDRGAGFAFVPDRLAALQVSAMPNAYSTTPQLQASFFREIEAHLAAIPGVRSAAIADELPLGDTHGICRRIPILQKH